MMCVSSGEPTSCGWYLKADPGKPGCRLAQIMKGLGKLRVATLPHLKSGVTMPLELLMSDKGVLHSQIMLTLCSGR